MQRIEINIHPVSAVPFTGTDYRRIQPGEIGKAGDDYFDYRSGQWLPDTNVTDEPFDPEVHAPARRRKFIHVPYDLESIPLPLLVRHKFHKVRTIIAHAEALNVLDGEGNVISYHTLLSHFTHDDGTPCGVLTRQ